METDQVKTIDITVCCCWTCKHYTPALGYEVPWGDCDKTGDEVNMHSECDEYEPI